MLNFDDCCSYHILTHINISDHIQITSHIHRVFLWGMMGAGKSTLAKKLAHTLGWKSIDLDGIIEKERGMTIAEIFEQNGEAAFREMERKVLDQIIDQEKVIVAVGGGTPCFHGNDSHMKASGLCVWLDAPLPMLASRLIHSKEKRPLIKGLDEPQILVTLETLYEKRSDNYAKAHLIISINQMNVQQSTKMLTSIIRDKS